MSGSVLVARALLERLEWSAGRMCRCMGVPSHVCPCCKAVNDLTDPDDQHAPGCALAAALASPPHDCAEHCVLCAVRRGPFKEPPGMFQVHEFDKKENDDE